MPPVSGAGSGLQHVAGNDVEAAGAAALPFRCRAIPIRRRANFLVAHTMPHFSRPTASIPPGLNTWGHQPRRGTRVLEFEKLVDISFVPVCSPRLLEKHGAVKNAQIARAAAADPRRDRCRARGSDVADWSDWFKAAGVPMMSIFAAACASTVPITRLTQRVKARAFCWRTISWPTTIYAPAAW